ncbi:MAG: hypothetical protein HKN09_09300 [Saprospiraceae bacterium]|nr:hypothetical protein [Saprospiraceae bacterium]
MQHTVQINDKDKKQRSLLLSILFHVLLLLFLLLPCFSYFDPPKPIQGITILLGEETEEEIDEIKSTTDAKSNSSPEKVEEEKPKKVVNKPAPSANVKSKTTTDSAPVVVEKKKEETKKIEESKPTAEEIAAAKAAEEAQKKKEAKERFGSLFNKNNDSENSSSKGNPSGMPDASSLEGLSEAYGKAGEGLEDRGIVYQPQITDNTQKTGRVVVRICVDNEGQVISARYTQKGSTTTDSHLIKLAERSARQYKFGKSPLDEQCGNIVIDFKLK